jgi:hypothetical protein
MNTFQEFESIKKWKLVPIFYLPGFICEKTRIAPGPSLRLF